MSGEEHLREASDDTSSTNCATLSSNLAFKSALVRRATHPRIQGVSQLMEICSRRLFRTSTPPSFPAQQKSTGTTLKQAVLQTGDATRRHYSITTVARPKRAHRNREENGV